MLMATIYCVASLVNYGIFISSEIMHISDFKVGNSRFLPKLRKLTKTQTGRPVKNQPKEIRQREERLLLMKAREMLDIHAIE